ncbi:hypothetical protein V6N13_018709 [Hibiscus sabdariffa]
MVIESLTRLYCKSKSSGQIGVPACCVNMGLRNSIEMPILNHNAQEDIRAEAIATLEVGEKIGVTFDIPFNSVVEKFQELVESEAGH